MHIRLGTFRFHYEAFLLELALPRYTSHAGDILTVAVTNSPPIDFLNTNTRCSNYFFTITFVLVTS